MAAQKYRKAKRSRAQQISTNEGGTKSSLRVITAVFVALGLSGCGIIPGLGVSASSPAPSATLEAEEPDPLIDDGLGELPEASEEPGNLPISDPAAEPSQDDEQGKAESEEKELNAGSIELSFEENGAERVFAYTASHCVVSADYMLVEGTGTEEATGEPSTINVFASPAELLHEGTGTYQADGLIRFSADDREMITDGRLITVEGSTIPSVFTYRATEGSAHFVVTWFEGASRAGAGYVKIECNYGDETQ